jgi:hypothetical protein
MVIMKWRLIDFNYCKDAQARDGHAKKVVFQLQKLDTNLGCSNFSVFAFNKTVN